METCLSSNLSINGGVTNRAAINNPKCIAIDKKYEFPVKILNPDDGSVTEQIFYGAVLDGVRCRDFVPAFFNYQKNEWLFYGRKVLPEPEKVHGTIKCALELSYCNEKEQ